MALSDLIMGILNHQTEAEKASLYGQQATLGQQAETTGEQQRALNAAALAKQQLSDQSDNYLAGLGIRPDNPNYATLKAAHMAGGLNQLSQGTDPNQGTQWQRAATGYNGGLGAMGGMGDVAGAGANTATAQALQSAAINQRDSIQPLQNQTKLIGAASELSNAPYQAANSLWENQQGVPANLVADYIKTTHPGLGGTGLNMLSINPDLTNPSVSTTANPLRTPMMDLMGRTINPEANGGGINNLPMKPQGNGINIPAINYDNALGQGLIGRVGLSPDIKPEHDIVTKSDHNAAMAAHDAAIANLKAQKAQLQANHMRSGVIPQVAHGLAAYAKEAANKTGGLIGNAVSPVYNYLIGQ